MPSGGTQTKQTQVSSAPSWAEPALKDILAKSTNMAKSGVGMQYFPGSTVADYGDTTTGALSGIKAMATGGNPIDFGNAGSSLNSIIGGATAPTSAQTNLGAMASGQYLDGGSPAFQAALDYQTGKIEDAAKRSVSGAGRYGSRLATQGMTDSVAGNRFGAMSTELARQEGNMLTANGMIDSARQNANAGALSGIGAIPGFTESRYGDLDRLLGVGQAYDTKAQEKIAGEVDKFNFMNAAPWDLIGKQLGIATGAVGNYGTQKVNVPKQSGLQTGLGALTSLLGFL